MGPSKESARRFRLALLLLLPLFAGIAFRWQNEILFFAYQHLPFFERIPLPTEYGMYAVHDKVLTPIMTNASPLQNFPSAVEFVCFPQQEVKGKWSLERVPYEPATTPAVGESPWKRWLQEVRDFGRNADATLRGILPDALPRVETQSKSVPGRPFFERVIPAKPLKPGLYRLNGNGVYSNALFYVDQEKLQGECRTALRKAMDEKHWEDALHEAENGKVLGLNDPPFQKDIGEIRVRLAIQAAREAYQANNEQSTGDALSLARSLRRDDPELNRLQTEMKEKKEADTKQRVEEQRKYQETLAMAKVGTKVTPVDEGPADTGFLEFRTNLAKAIEEKNSQAVLAVVAEDIVNTTGQPSGKQSFTALWTPDDPKSELWQQLHLILKHGGRFGPDKTTFTAPFVYTDYRDSANLHQEIGVVVGTDVSVRSEPNVKSKLMGRVSYQLLQLQFGESPWFPDQEGGIYAWFSVRLPNGVEGYMSLQYLRSPLDYHAKFQKRKGEWKLVELANEWPRGD